MDDLENSPLMRVFHRKEKPLVSYGNTSTNSRLARRKRRNPELQKPLRTLQPCSIDKQKGCNIDSCNDICEENVAVSYSIKNQKKKLTPGAKFSSSSRRSSDSDNLFECADYVNHPEFVDTTKIDICSSKPETVVDGSTLCKKNEDMIDLTSDDDNCNSDLSNSVKIPKEHSVTKHFTFPRKKSKFIKSPSLLQSKESVDVQCIQESDCDIVTNTSTSENRMSQSVVNKTIKAASDNSLDKNLNDICEYMEKIKVADEPPGGNTACEIPCTPCTPEKHQSKYTVFSKTKELQALKALLSSDEDYSPPPLSKRLWAERRNDTPSAKSTKKGVVPETNKKRQVSSPVPVKRDVSPPVRSTTKKEVVLLSPMFNKKKNVFSWENVREEDSEMSSFTESSDGSDPDESSGSEDFEQFLVELKTPVKKEAKSPKNKTVNTKNFIENDNSERKKLVSGRAGPPKAKAKVRDAVLSDHQSDIYSNYVSTKGKEKAACSDSDDRTDDSSPSEASGASQKSSSRRASFLASLSADVPDSLADPAALVYRKQFMKKKEELVEKLFALFNSKVFNGKLPKDTKVTWNHNLTKTAGKCYCKKDFSLPLGRIARIELAPKILDCPDRVRDTLAHEMCHAACWLIHGVHGGHGSFWKFWACRVQQMFPEIPPVTRCHNYQISTKYVYVCTGCGGKIGRHSKSIDISKSVCSRCKSKFKLVVNGKSTETPSKPATGFALFVKENYGNLKKKHAGVKHGDIMKMLSAEFAQKTKISA